MTKVQLEIYDDVIAALNKIQGVHDAGVEVEIPEGSILFENVLNLKLIKQHADRYSITVHFLTKDPTGNKILDMIESGGERFNASATDIEERIHELDTVPLFSNKFKGIAFPALSKIKLPKFKLSLLPILIALLLVGIFHFTQSRRKADVKIVINSQPLARSLTLKAKAGTATDPQNKILAGSTVKNTVEITRDLETTGEKIIGEKAEGVVKIYNKTDTERTFKKGRVLTYEKDDKDYDFTTNEEITVPERTEDLTDPLNPKITYGEAEVEVTAADVGSAYNIESGETLSVDGYKKADFSAVSKEDFSGGKSEKKKAVADVDITKLKSQIEEAITKESNSALESKVQSSQSLISGSTKSTLIKESIDHKVGDEADKLSITRTVEIEGLVYLKTELDRMLDSIVKEFVPEGFALSSKERQVNVEVLGNSTNSVLNSAEADLQVTLKTFIVPDITEDKIKQDIAGKSRGDVEKILGSIGSVKNYEFTMTQSLLPMFYKIPTNKDKINVEIVRE